MSKFVLARSSEPQGWKRGRAFVVFVRKERSLLRIPDEESTESETDVFLLGKLTAYAGGTKACKRKVQ
ncbi:hypothetical protein BG53_05995 [Paenibacillus darwinianus]|uniref:Uncharacterized protein n=1 Tax=Paenibacillus darwinianus TaxID=1380763 RepID=A0A9W5RZY5_9BACL|nr:hypothetical protein BG53_05995 [Paenibacillus darwinianus]EXX87553.1 hypothetical protein BG52_03840 [Paenibacillus darwinianus]